MTEDDTFRKLTRKTFEEVQSEYLRWLYSNYLLHSISDASSQFLAERGWTLREYFDESERRCGKPSVFKSLYKL
jgi:hypothetical protein